MSNLNKGVDSNNALRIPKAIMQEIGITKKWEGVTMHVCNDTILIKKAVCPRCKTGMTEMKRGGLVCACGYVLELHDQQED